jgi:hypothetical protein
MVNKYTAVILALVLMQCFICVSNCLQAQTSKTFWFVAPDLSSGHEQSPIVLRLINGNSTPATVTISEPANTANFSLITLTIPANTLSSFDLSSLIAQVEDQPANTTNKYGILISSDQYISAYYEESGVYNPAIYVLKGDNALGTNFLIPGQNLLNNVSTVNPLPYNSFHIVATEDNTTVTITPRNAIVGHAAGVSFTVTLNKGQTYSAVAISQMAAYHLGGSRVTSSKPIAITVCDDSMYGGILGGTCYNQGGDQIIPVNLLGKSYVAVRGYLGVGTSSTVGDQVFAMATQPNTDIYINSVKAATLANVGDIYNYNMGQSADACFIQGSKNISVVQMSGFGCEADYAILSQLECTGSRAVTIARSVSDSYYLTVLVESGGEGNFTLSTSSGSGATLVATDFSVVPGTGGKYLYTRKSFSTSQIAAGATVTLTNSTNKFHVGIIHGTQSTGCRFGYFSEYSSSQAKFDPPTVNVCLGNPINLTPAFKVSRTVDPTTVLYSWNVPDGMGGRIVTSPSNATPSYQIPNASLAQSGKYIVHVSADGCDANDTATVNVINSPLRVNDAVTVCSNELPYVWNGKKYSVAGKYTDTLVSVLGGCDSIVTKQLIINPAYLFDESHTICQSELPYSYRDTIFKVGTSSGTYVLKRKTILGCDSIFRLNLTVNPVYNLKDSRSLCASELPYAYADTLFNGGTVSGNYQFKRKSVNGCDSIVTLALTVHSLENTVLNDTVVQHKIYSKYGFSVPAQTVCKTYTYSQYLKTVYGCDSTVVLNLTVSPDFSAAMRASPQICADDKDFTLNYDIVYGNIEYHSVVFDSKAQQAGFVDIAKQTANGYVDVTLPSGVTPDIYNASVVFDNGPITKKLPVSFTVNYPSSIIKQKWNDVLALFNSSYNGGYDFADFQWYKNGQAIDGATESYLYTENGQLDTSAQYQVKVTRTLDQVSLFTCSFQPTLHTDVLVYPTLLSRRSPITIKMDEKGSGLLLNISGLKINQQALNPGENSMRAPDSAGTYVLVLTNSQGESKKQLLIVK